MYLAGFIVAGFLIAARLRVRAAARSPQAATSARRSRVALTAAALAAPRADRRRRLGRARRRPRPAGQAGRDRRAPARRRRGAPDAPPRLVRRHGRSASASRSRGCSRCSRSTTRTRPCRGSTRCRPTTGRPSTSCAIAFQTMVGIGTLLALLGVVHLVACLRRAAAADVARGSCAPWSPPGRSSVVALVAGWVTTEVGRQPWVVYGVMRTSDGGHRARAASRSATRRSSLVYAGARGRDGVDPAAPRGAPLDLPRSSRRRPSRRDGAR